MTEVEATLDGSGLEVFDLRDDDDFAARRLHVRDVKTQMQGVQRLTRAFVERPETLLEELVSAAIELCGADSAGISLEKQGGTNDQFYEWVATAGVYSGFLHATLPRYPSACGVCLERGTPQLFRVSKRFFELLGVEAPEITDGLLFPWQTDETRGTIFVMAHGRDMAFDSEDCKLMQMLADFAVLGVRHQEHQQKNLLEKAAVSAAAIMANDLAHQINNPLQSLTNLVYMAQHSRSSEDTKQLAQDLLPHLDRLTTLVKRLLALPMANG